ncbi:MAG: MBL fold metallo-hydrolase [Pseudomonadales bacterium]|jgi:glyoxylase-like metal-dependent hydrolase (beta-lactamase superfamily II)|nr:MBL fold metallo-hydrolase [Pseudomonadales bacterium]MDP6472138.1 MBL fold metallo-hydrolase [Pseudomonadales bacterium]MDP6826610.1 MBL fold metallo-hydrolase [Pseudomonadales bacterium]MDP6970119.1 MBL fold metallo-hydrolase [Pseudomonadales bacterium]|tara:strand:+ start:31 stop:1065 length:1035 start_codon:yes stop_codon:yes gene_type:complete
MTYRTLRGALLCAALSALPSIWAAAGEADVLETDTHRFTEVRNDIWLAQGTAPVFNSNSLVIVNDDDVVVVDSHVTPSKARDLIAAIKVLTPKPITALINSHHHWDHAHGNQEFDGIPIIGHEFTYTRLATAPLDEPTYVNGLKGNDDILRRVKEGIASTTDPKRKQELETYLELFTAHVGDFDEIDPVPPTITLSERMTLYRGMREIQIIFLGRAHTGGDVVVYFPEDRLVFTGDVAFAGPSYLGDGFVDEWPQTLDNLKALDFDVFVPGHGFPVTDLRRIDLVQEFYRDLWAKAAAMHARGIDAQTAARTIDLTNHTEIPVSEVGASQLSIDRIYHRLDHPD